MLVCCLEMGVDVMTYRARIGKFRPGCKKKHAEKLRFGGTFGIFGTFPSGVMRLSVIVLLLLVAAGDVEQNPGPVNNTEKIEKLQKAVDSLLSNTNRYQEENSKKLDAINSGIASIGCRVSKLEERVDAIERSQEGLSAASLAHAIPEQNVVNVQRQVVALGDLVDDMNSRMRRNNLVFRGISEKENETWNDTEAIVAHFVRENLGINMGTVERAHRLGMKRADFNRPVMVKFLDFKNKQEVLRNAFKLKNLSSEIRLCEDFSPRVRFARKKLWEFARQFREQDIKYKISFNKLLVNNSAYVYDDHSDSVKQLGDSQRQHSPRQ